MSYNLTCEVNKIKTTAVNDKLNDANYTSVSSMARYANDTCA